jgi:hypothetical protein
VPDELAIIRKHAERYLLAQDDPKWKLTNLMISYSKLCANVRHGYLSNEDYLQQSLELDAKLVALMLQMPSSWRYINRTLSEASEFAFGYYYDTYPDRYITQTWNVIRLVRIMLNKSIIKHWQFVAKDMAASPSTTSAVMADANMKRMAHEICASVRQYTDCSCAAGNKSPLSQSLDGSSPEVLHSHTPSQHLDCYSLIFPLYVVGHSAGLGEMRQWVVKQLRHIASHFNIPNADVVCQILEEGKDLNPWSVYAVLGSYAFCSLRGAFSKFVRSTTWFNPGPSSGSDDSFSLSNMTSIGVINKKATRSRIVGPGGHEALGNFGTRIHDSHHKFTSCIRSCITNCI